MALCICGSILVVWCDPVSAEWYVIATNSLGWFLCVFVYHQHANVVSRGGDLKNSCNICSHGVSCTWVPYLTAFKFSITWKSHSFYPDAFSWNWICAIIFVLMLARLDCRREATEGKCKQRPEGREAWRRTVIRRQRLWNPKSGRCNPVCRAFPLAKMCFSVFSRDSADQSCRYAFFEMSQTVTLHASGRGLVTHSNPSKKGSIGNLMWWQCDVPCRRCPFEVLSQTNDYRPLIVNAPSMQICVRNRSADGSFRCMVFWAWSVSYHC